MTRLIGILAYGSLLSDPGKEIADSQIGVIEDVETPFPVEFARSSKSRGGAPTLIPVDTGGAKVRGRIMLVNASSEEATNMLYRREIHQVGSDKNYKVPEPEEANKVRVEALSSFMRLDTVLYTKISSNIFQITAEELARLAVKSVASSEVGKDGISYLIAAKENGIRTALSDMYEKEILRMAGTASLEDALCTLQSGGLKG